MGNKIGYWRTPHSKACEQLCVNIAIILSVCVVLLKIPEIIRCGWEWVWYVFIGWFMLLFYVGMLANFGRAVLELLGLVEMDVDEVVKSHLDYWIEQRSTESWGEYMGFEVSENEIHSAEARIRITALEDRRSHNWMWVLYFTLLTISPILLWLINRLFGV